MFWQKAMNRVCAILGREGRGRQTENRPGRSTGVETNAARAPRPRIQGTERHPTICCEGHKAWRGGDDKG
jgi:hypothetical protein